MKKLSYIVIDLYISYYQDTEMGFYYLMTRYYDPVTHRFINSDGYFQAGGDLLDTNMNIYCRNNPINLSDTTGCYCREHKSWYLPTCRVCRGIPLTPAPLDFLGN